MWFPNLWSSAGFVSTCSTLNLSPWFLCVLGYFHLESSVREKSVTSFLSVFLYESWRSIIISNREVKSQILCWITWDNLSFNTHRNLQPKPRRTDQEHYPAELVKFPFAWLQPSRWPDLLWFSAFLWRPRRCWWRVLIMTLFYRIHKELFEKNCFQIWEICVMHCTI